MGTLRLCFQSASQSESLSCLSLSVIGGLFCDGSLLRYYSLLSASYEAQEALDWLGDVIWTLIRLIFWTFLGAFNTIWGKHRTFSKRVSSPCFTSFIISYVYLCLTILGKQKLCSLMQSCAKYLDDSGVFRAVAPAFHWLFSEVWSCCLPGVWLRLWTWHSSSAICVSFPSPSLSVYWAWSHCLGGFGCDWWACRLCMCVMVLTDSLSC